jgi:hypothetical protein
MSALTAMLLPLLPTVSPFSKDHLLMLASTDFGNVLLGVIATGLAGLLALIFNRIVIPWYQEKVHRGVSLSGTWVGSQTSARGTFGFRFELRQIGPKVKGIFYSNDEYGGKKRARTHTLGGEIRHNHLILNYMNREINQMGLGGFLFCIRDGGDEIFGSMLFFQTDTGNVHSSNELRLCRVAK